MDDNEDELENSYEKGGFSPKKIPHNNIEDESENTADNDQESQTMEDEKVIINSVSPTCTRKRIWGPTIRKMSRK